MIPQKWDQPATFSPRVCYTLYVFTFSLGGSTEPPEPPLDPLQKAQLSPSFL